jgi:acetolactate synthase-1/2/3 large subunit
VIARLARTFPTSTVIANDAGNFSIFGHRYWRFTEAHTQVAPTSGAMGYGVPAAIGAKLARPDRSVVALVGDGGFLMTGQEMETAVRHDLPITVVVFRNGLYGTIAFHQARVGRLPVSVDIGTVDLAAVARGYGALAWSPRTADELTDALAEARTCKRPALLDVVVDPDAITPDDRLSAMLQRRDDHG